jgi:predicted nuclease of predicted toxin-antitoxin system
MKLLFDQNLSPNLATRLSDAFPGSAHVYPLGLHQASDQQIWEYAKENEYLIVTKDADFSELVVLKGFPPKVLWIRLGNCTTSQIEGLLRHHSERIKHFSEEAETGFLSLTETA